jgi:hypothetical protein
MKKYRGNQEIMGLHPNIGGVPVSLPFTVSEKKWFFKLKICIRI